MEKVIFSIKFVLLISYTILFMTCFQPLSALFKYDHTPLNDIPESWIQYGAYYENDQTLIVATTKGYDLVTRIMVSRRMRILNTSGMIHANVKVEKPSKYIEKFELSVSDANQKQIAINEEFIKENFKKTGVIVFPQAEPGTTLDFFIQFRSYEPLFTYEHWFAREIPIKKGEFIFHSSPKLGYEEKQYSETHKIAPVTHYWNRKKIRGWQVKNLAPPPKSEWANPHKIGTHRVAIVLKRVFHQPFFRDWSSLAKTYKRFLNTLTSWDIQLKKHTKKINQQLEGDYNKADSALHWMQKNIALSENRMVKRRRVHKVLESGSGDYLEMSAMLYRMYKYLNFQTDVVMTRPWKWGGFDPHFISPEQVIVPVVIVKVNNKIYAAVPYMRNGKLGEYPFAWRSLKGLALDAGRVVSLPSSVARESYFISQYLLNVNDDTKHIPNHLQLNISGNIAFDLRNALSYLYKEHTKDEILFILQEFGIRPPFEKEHIVKIDLPNLQKRGGSLSINISFDTPIPIVKKGRKILVPLDQFLHHYFLYDLINNKKSIDLNHTLNFIDMITIPQRDNKKYTFIYPQNELSNKLFDSSYKMKKNEREYILTRKVIVKDSPLNEQELNAINPDFIQLMKKDEVKLIMQ